MHIYIILFLFLSFSLFSDSNSSNSIIVKYSNPPDDMVVPYKFYLYDYPFNSKEGSLVTRNGNPVPSMEESLSLAKNINQLAHRGIAYFVNENMDDFSPYKKRIAAILSIATFDLAGGYLPLGTSWLHEEWHRAVMGSRNISSFDEVYTTSFGASVISVSHIRDDDLSELKKNHPAEMVRLSSSGMEAQSYMNRELRKDSFYYGIPAYYDSVIQWMNVTNNIFYMKTCASKDADSETRNANIREGTNIKKRDFTGYDCNGYVYDLFRPKEPYEARGIHPSGNGVDRYIKYSDSSNPEYALQNYIQYGTFSRHSDLNDMERKYLELQYRLSYINLISPALFNISGFASINPLNHKPFYWNFSFAHYLTPFGNSIDLALFYKQEDLKLLITYHNYSNSNLNLPGIEIELLRYPLVFYNIQIYLNSTIHIWLQPDKQMFWANSYNPGGLAKIGINYPIYKYLELFIDVSAKTRGWVAGNVYIEKALEIRTGVNLLF